MLSRLRGGLPPFVQFVGLAIAALGLGLLSVPVGVIAAGLGLFVVGWLYDQRQPR